MLIGGVACCSLQFWSPNSFPSTFPKSPFRESLQAKYKPHRIVGHYVTHAALGKTGAALACKGETDGVYLMFKVPLPRFRLHILGGRLLIRLVQSRLHAGLVFPLDTGT